MYLTEVFLVAFQPNQNPKCQRQVTKKPSVFRLRAKNFHENFKVKPSPMKTYFCSELSLIASEKLCSLFKDSSCSLSNSEASSGFRTMN